MKAALAAKPDSTHVSLGRAVRRMRARQHVSRRQLAAACEMRWRDLVRLEYGWLNPDMRLLVRLSAVLDGTLTTLMLQIANEQYLAEIGGPRRLISSAADHAGAVAGDTLLD